MNKHTPRTICCVVTSRASYARIKTALQAIDAHPKLTLQLVAAGSAVLERYGDASKVMEADGFTLAAKVDFVEEGENLLSTAHTTGRAVTMLADCFAELKPDAVITIADRYETLATSIAASYMNIPLVHVQGGEVTGSIDEKVRHANTKLADLHFTATSRARDYVIRMGEDAERVFWTGCPSIDIAADIVATPPASFDPITQYGEAGNLTSLEGGYIIVMHHPVTTEYADAVHAITETLAGVHATGANTLWFWPNVDAGADAVSTAIRDFMAMKNPQQIRFFNNIPPEHFLHLLAGSQCIVGNSSVGIREAAFLGVPTVNIGTRQANRERGPNVTDVANDRHAIEAAITQAITTPRPAPSHLYGDGHAGKKIADILATVALPHTKCLSYVLE